MATARIYTLFNATSYGNQLTASILVYGNTHEIVELITDGDGTEWYSDSTGDEVADICRNDTTFSDYSDGVQPAPYFDQKTHNCVVPGGSTSVTSHQSSANVSNHTNHPFTGMTVWIVFWDAPAATWESQFNGTEVINDMGTLMQSLLGGNDSVYFSTCNSTYGSTTPSYSGSVRVQAAITGSSPNTFTQNDWLNATTYAIQNLYQQGKITLNQINSNKNIFCVLPSPAWSPDQNDPNLKGVGAEHFFYDRDFSYLASTPPPSPPKSPAS